MFVFQAHRWGIFKKKLMEWGIPSPSIHRHHRPEPYGSSVDVVHRVSTSYTQQQNKHVQITTTTPPPSNYRKMAYNTLQPVYHIEDSLLQNLLVGWKDTSHWKEPSEARSSGTAGTRDNSRSTKTSSLPFSLMLVHFPPGLSHRPGRPKWVRKIRIQGLVDGFYLTFLCSISAVCFLNSQ